jgi:hypothetical protein
MTDTILWAAMALAVAAGYVASYLHGYSRGRAYGWQEGYFGKARDERGRRDHFGRFRAKDAPKHTL